ncbi:fimbrial protein [Enterobacter hormaechei]
MNKYVIFAGIWLLSFSAHSFVSGQPMGFYPCAPGGENLLETYGDNCTVTPRADHDGIWMYGPNQTWQSKRGTSYIGIWDSYIPHPGKFAMRAHVCEVAKASDECTIMKSIDTIDSHYVSINPSLSLNDGQVDFMGPTKTAAPKPFPTKICYTLVDEAGQEFKSNDANSCIDGDSLPDHPVQCRLDSVNLNVTVDVKRGKLSSSATNGSGITKQLQMTCDGTTSSSFELSLSAKKQIEIDNGTVVGTSTKGLGIALYYNDKLLSLGTDLFAEFAPGTTPIKLEFVPVRDPAIPVNKISTGDFSADAVLVMTQQ